VLPKEKKTRKMIKKFGGFANNLNLNTKKKEENTFKKTPKKKTPIKKNINFENEDEFLTQNDKNELLKKFNEVLENTNDINFFKFDDENDSELINLFLFF
jgi:hypothetical protein